MKKIFYLSLFSLLAVQQAEGQIIVDPAIQGSLVLATNNFSTPMSVVYNPVHNVYYATSGGNPSDQMVTFDGIGTYLTSTTENIDYRGAWWNENTNRMECNEWNSTVMKAQDIDPVSGWALSTFQNLGNIGEPTSQNMGAYDKNNNWVVYYNNNQLYEYDYVTGNQVAVYTLSGMPGNINLNTYPIGATGCPGKDYVVYDNNNKQALFINTTGQYVGMSQLPAAAPTPGSYGMSYSGGYLWLCDQGTATWYNYQVILCDPCAATITAAGPTQLCAGNNVVLNANTGINYSYQWKLNGGDIGGATTSSYTAAVAGTYTVFVSHDTCLGSTSPGIEVTVSTPPPTNIDAAGPISFCDGGSVELDATNGAYTYQWMQDGNTIGGATDYNFIANASGSYDVTITNGGCTVTTSQIVVTVNPVPIATITAGGPVTFCAGGSVVLNGSVGINYSYQWNMDGNPINGATNANYTATQAGTYTLFISANGCTATSNGVTVTVTTVPVAGITAAGPLTFCANDSLVLNANPPTNGITFQWRLNGAAIAGATTTSYIVHASGTYSVKETNGGSCSDTSAGVVVVVNPLPTPTITRTNLTLLAANIYSTYQWYRNGNSINGATHNNYTANSNGTYVVKVTDSAGCAGYDTLIIANVGVQGVQYGAKGVSLYPNPNTGTFTLAGDVYARNNELTVIVTDITGREVLHQSVPVNNNTLNTQVSLDGKLPPGQYMLKMQDDEQNYVLPFVKQ